MKIKLVILIITLLIWVGFVGKHVATDKINPVSAEQSEVELTKIFTIEQLNDMDYGLYKFNTDFYSGAILKFSDGYGIKYSIGWTYRG